VHPQLGEQDWITSYGLMLAVAVAACWWLSRRNAVHAGADPSHVDFVVPLAFIGGLLASLWAGGGHVRLIPLIAGAIGVVFVYGRLTRQSLLALVDILAVPTLVAIAIQRFGCLLAGCCWGEPVKHDALAWLGVHFPRGSFAWEQQRIAGILPADASASLAVHATQLYEAVLLLAVALVLGRSGIRRIAPGGTTLVAIGAYATIRFGIEFLRADNAAWLGPLSATQIVCLALLAGTVAGSRMNTNTLH
jgi:phosphatidylglycerol:prolipoprotein diacylglycerol transferase